MNYPCFEEVSYNSADELWEALSPTKELFSSPSKVIFRGQADATWGLLPSILRGKESSPASTMWGKSVTADEQVFSVA